MDALRKEELCTVDYIYKLPEGVRAELIDGQIYYMASPSTNHQRLVMNLSVEIKNYIDRNNGDCEVFPAPFAVFLNKDSINYVEPDISVVCDRDKLDDEGCHGAPDWIIEITSPTSKSMDYYKKLFKYRTACVREYWVVDIDRTLVTVYDFVNDDMKEYPFGEEIPAGIYEGFHIKVEL